MRTAKIIVAHLIGHLNIPWVPFCVFCFHQIREGGNAWMWYVFMSGSMAVAWWLHWKAVDLMKSVRKADRQRIREFMENKKGDPNMREFKIAKTKQHTRSIA